MTSRPLRGLLPGFRDERTSAALDFELARRRLRRIAEALGVDADVAEREAGVIARATGLSSVDACVRVEVDLLRDGLRGRR